MSDVKKFVKKKPANLNFGSHTRNAGRSNSLGALEELVQCGICLDKLKDPRMLPCQHTFCLECLQADLVLKKLVVKKVRCPLCQATIDLDKGVETLKGLPKNFYIDSLLKLLREGESPMTPKAMDYLCSKCQIVSEKEEHVCQHCTKIFCYICWTDHIAELDTNLSVLIKQIEESGARLKHKADNFSNRCNQLEETVRETVRVKIAELKKMEAAVLGEVKEIQTQGRIVYECIGDRMEVLKEKIQAHIDDGQIRSNKVSTYMNMHRETASLFEEIYHYGEARIVFDPETLKIDQDKEGIYNDVGDGDNKDSSRTETVENPYENIHSMIKHYKNRPFTPKLLWTKCPKPGGVAVAPWDSTKLYITATDTKNILVLDRQKFKLTATINDPQMICPTKLAFSKATQEMFVTDKWKHCVHVFSRLGKYSRNLDKLQLRNPDGIAIGPNGEVIVCDTGNNRIVVADPQTGHVMSVIGKGELHMPMDIAVYESHVVVADTGNNKIKTFDLQGQLVREIGTLGRGKGQFRSAEVVAVDCWGFVLVGDAGNARIQVFQPNGSLVKIFGRAEGFGWISGIHVTPELDIITTDSKNRSLTIF